jgi:hypothetical protein
VLSDVRPEFARAPEGPRGDRSQWGRLGYLVSQRIVPNSPGTETATPLRPKVGIGLVRGRRDKYH